MDNFSLYCNDCFPHHFLIWWSCLTNAYAASAYKCIAINQVNAVLRDVHVAVKVTEWAWLQGGVEQLCWRSDWANSTTRFSGLSKLQTNTEFHTNNWTLIGLFYVLYHGWAVVLNLCYIVSLTFWCMFGTQGFPPWASLALSQLKRNTVHTPSRGPIAFCKFYVADTELLDIYTRPILSRCLLSHWMENVMCRQLLILEIDAERHKAH